MTRGYNSLGDVIRTTDGTDLSSLWSEFNDTLDLANRERSALVSLLTYRTTSGKETVLQSPTGTADFEQATEYGVPSGLRAEQATLPMGVPFAWFDLAARYTWQFLADASAGQVAALHNAAIEADNRLVTRTVLSALFRNANRSESSTDATVYSLWNGADGQTPPPYGRDTFAPAHNHYLTTAGGLDPRDVADTINNVRHHGYSEVVLLCHPDQGDEIATWRATTTGSPFDFISSDRSVPYLTTENLVGTRPGDTFRGMAVSGQWGHALVAPTHHMPRGYLAAVSVGGATPVVALREHPTLPGLRIIEGPRTDYPLIDSYYVHGLGASVRQRGGAAVLQVTDAATYSAPAGL